MPNNWIEMSAAFSYTLTRKLNGIKVGGSTSWWATRVTKIYGNCSEELYPTSKMVEENQIPIKAFLDAYPRRIDYYQRLYTVNDCLHAIYKNKIGISLSFDIFSSFESARNGDVQYPQIGEKYLGSHSVHVYGYSNLEGEKNFNFVNSWGTGWGNKGKGTLPFKYFEDGLVSEAWAMSGAYCDPIGGEKVFSLRTKQGCDFKLSIKCYPSLRHSPYPLSSFDITVGGVHVGHLHLSFYDEENLEIEEFYILPQFQKQGIGTTAMKVVEEYATQEGFVGLLGWVGAQDIIDERDSKVKRFFNKNHFELKDDNSRFRDAVYKFHKKLSKSKKQIFWNYPSK